MKTKAYRVAIIGCGHMGQAHMDHIYYKDNVSVTYACDLDLERARMFQKKYGVKKITKDYHMCTQAEDVDIVIISTYPSTHLAILKECIKHKKHVICEKPITASLEEGKEFVALVKKHPECKVLIGHILRHNKTYQTAARMIRSGAIGFPIIVRMVQNHHTMNWEKYRQLIAETSPLIDCGVHYIDIVQWFTESKINKVQAIGLRTEKDIPIDKYNYGLMTMQLEDGSIGYYEAGWSNTMSSDNLKEFVGPKGRIRLVFEKDRTSHSEEGDLLEYYQYPEKTYEIINIKCERKPTDLQFDYLIDMIEKGHEATPTIEEVYNSFELAFKADACIKNQMSCHNVQEINKETVKEMAI